MKIQIEATAKTDLATVWRAWNSPEHVVHWNAASPEWHCPRSAIDLRVGGRFVTRMEARDGSMGFDFGGTYTEVVPNERVAFRLDDGREASVAFHTVSDGVHIREAFEAEGEHSADQQRDGWQSILNSFVAYVESDPRARP